MCLVPSIWNIVREQWKYKFYSSSHNFTHPPSHTILYHFHPYVSIPFHLPTSPSHPILSLPTLLQLSHLPPMPPHGSVFIFLGGSELGTRTMVWVVTEVTNSLSLSIKKPLQGALEERELVQVWERPHRVWIWVGILRSFQRQKLRDEEKKNQYFRPDDTSWEWLILNRAKGGN